MIKRTGLCLFLFLLWAGPVTAQTSSEMSTLVRQLEGLQDLIEFRRPSSSATVRYPNNQVATNNFGSASSTWYWPNGKTITNNARSMSASWYWPNGQTMTNQIGSSSATWYWPDGQILSLSGPGYSARDLEDIPGLALRLLKMAGRRG